MPSLEKENNTKSRGKSAFTLMELSIVMIIIGIIFSSIVAGNSMISAGRLTNARGLTNSSPILSINNMAFWFEATSKNSFPKGEHIENGAVTLWNDINPHNSNPHIATAQNSPIYRRNGINKLPAIEFDGANTFFSIPDTKENSIAGDMTLFAVVNVANAATAYNILSKSNSSYRWRVSFGERWFLIDDGSGLEIVGSGNVPVGDPAILAVVVDIGTNIKFSENKVNTQTVATTKTSIANTSDDLLIGAFLATPSEVFSGQIGEIIAFNRKLSLEEQDVVHDYLSKKWKIALK